MDERVETINMISLAKNNVYSINEYLKTSNSLKRKIKNELKLILIEMKGIFTLIEKNAEDDEILSLTKDALLLLNSANQRLFEVAVI